MPTENTAGTETQIKLANVPEDKREAITKLWVEFTANIITILREDQEFTQGSFGIYIADENKQYEFLRRIHFDQVGTFVTAPLDGAGIDMSDPEVRKQVEEWAKKNRL